MEGFVVRERNISEDRDIRTNWHRGVKHEGRQAILYGPFVPLVQSLNLARQSIEDFVKCFLSLVLRLRNFAVPGWLRITYLMKGKNVIKFLISIIITYFNFILKV